MPIALVVDDSLVDRRLVGKILERHCNCTVIDAADGIEALRQLEQRPIDVVVTDLQMPKMNGLELVAAVRDDYPTIPTILMTARGSEDIAAEALQKGAASYVPKKKLAFDLPNTFRRVFAASREERTHSRLMHHLTHGEVHFELHNDLSMIRSVEAYLQQMLRCLPLGDQTERVRVGIALEEALKNALYHGNLEIAGSGDHSREDYDELAAERLTQEPYRDRRIYVSARISRSEAVFCIRDDGAGFDVSQLPKASDQDHFDASTGRGLVLLHSVMDEVKYNDAGNEVTLVKRAMELSEEECEPDDE